MHKTFFNIMELLCYVFFYGIQEYISCCYFPWFPTSIHNTCNLIRINADTPMVALTYDDGPSEQNTPVILDALRVIDSDEIDIYFLNSRAPMFIRDEAQSYIYMVLPVNFV